MNKNNVICSNKRTPMHYVLLTKGRHLHMWWGLTCFNGANIPTTCTVMCIHSWRTLFNNWPTDIKYEAWKRFISKDVRTVNTFTTLWNNLRSIQYLLLFFAMVTKKRLLSSFFIYMCTCLWKHVSPCMFQFM